MIWPSAALVLCGVAMSIAALGGCTSSAPPEGEPTFYQNLAQPDVTVDAAAAASMISGYRSNNGLGAVTVDPELMRMASEQARAMAAHDKMDHDIGRPFQERIRNSPFAGSVAVENISAGYHTLAEAFSGWRDSPPHRANMLNRGVTRLGIAAAFAPGSKYQGVLGADPDWARASRLVPRERIASGEWRIANVWRMFVIASASEAIQGGLRKKLDCFVALAPRNDGDCYRVAAHRRRMPP